MRNPETGKQKIEFKASFDVRTREDLELLTKVGDREVKKAIKGISFSESLNTCFKGYKHDYFEFVKFVKVPCGRCSECLKSNAQGWSFRILKEAELYDENYFITLTYDDEHLPSNKMLVKDEISKFNKKLKTYLNRKGLPSDFRFYGVGEYGGQTARPHYHVIYFNLMIPDLHFEYVDNGNLIFSSEFIRSVWSKGHIVIGNVDVASACYVARYCDKKRLLNQYEKDDLLSKGIVPEFSIMSRMPGIGSHFIPKVVDGVVSQCYNLSVKGRNYSIPQFYSKKIKEILANTPELAAYEKNASFKSFNKLSRDLLDHDNIEDWYRFLDKEKINNKKRRKL